MRTMERLAILLGVIGLAACTESRPPMSGASPGPGAPPLQQRSAEQPHSAPVSAGTPGIAGARGGGRPEVTRSGAGSGDLGGVPPTQQLRSRSN